MTPELPQIPDPADRRAFDRFGEDIGRILVLLAQILERGDPQIDLAHLEARELDGIESDQGELLELLRQQPVVPGRDFGKPVVGDHKGMRLIRIEVFEAQCRHLAPTKLAAGGETRVAGDHCAIAIDQDGRIKPERLDAVRDLPDLLRSVPARVGGIRLELVDRSINNNQACR